MVEKEAIEMSIARLINEFMGNDLQGVAQVIQQYTHGTKVKFENGNVDFIGSSASLACAFRAVMMLQLSKLPDDEDKADFINMCHQAVPMLEVPKNE